MCQIKISIIIPCYNVEKYIIPLVSSLLKQIDGKSVEIICVNDGSTDNTLNCLKSLATENNNLHIINQENGGPASARNSGLDIAKGEYIWFIDGDDSIDKLAINTLTHEIEENPTDVICFNYKRVDTNGNILSTKNYKYDYINSFTGTEAYAKFKIPSYLWNRIIRRDIIEKNQIRFDFWPEDEDFLINIYLAANSFRFIRDTIYYYNDVEGSISKCVDSYCNYYEGYFHIMKKYKHYTRTEKNNRFWQRLIWSCIKNILINYNRVKAGNYSREIDERITMYTKIQQHLSLYKNCISYKGITGSLILIAKYFPFLLDLPCYILYKTKIKNS